MQRDYLALPGAVPLERALRQQQEPPRPLQRELPPAEPFPVDALGDLLGCGAKAIQEQTQAPLAICGCVISTDVASTRPAFRQPDLIKVNCSTHAGPITVAFQCGTSILIGSSTPLASISFFASSRLYSQ